MERRSLFKILGGTGGAAAFGLIGFGRMGHRQITVRGTDDVPTQFPIQLDAEVIDDKSTNSDSSIIQISMSNQTKEQIVQFSTGWPGVFTAGNSRETPGLMLIARGHNNRPIRNPICPKPISNYNIPTLLLATELQPEETRHVKFDIWGKKENSLFNCIPKGTYSFESTYYEGPSIEENFTWGFTLDVK